MLSSRRFLKGEATLSVANRTLIDKIRSLPADRHAEAEDFVDFIAARERARSITRAAAAASAPAFGAIWNNPDDDDYDGS
jgi:hypothetical protein